MGALHLKCSALGRRGERLICYDCLAGQLTPVVVPPSLTATCFQRTRVREQARHNADFATSHASNRTSRETDSTKRKSLDGRNSSDKSHRSGARTSRDTTKTIPNHLCAGLIASSYSTMASVGGLSRFTGSRKMQPCQFQKSICRGQSELVPSSSGFPFFCQSREIIRHGG